MTKTRVFWLSLLLVLTLGAEPIEATVVTVTIEIAGTNIDQPNSVYSAQDWMEKAAEEAANSSEDYAEVAVSVRFLGTDKSERVYLRNKGSQFPILHSTCKAPCDSDDDYWYSPYFSNPPSPGGGGGGGDPSPPIGGGFGGADLSSCHNDVYVSCTAKWGCDYSTQLACY